ncbi:MAG: hypothetical protein ACYSTS_15120 [Planctomycetota bacterium]|jgi:hypothetical protein
MSDIIKKMGERRKSSSRTDIVSMFHQDLKRAIKIIKNVELGNFPGDYQLKSKN